MTAKRFTVDDGLEDVLCWEINDKENEDMTCGECAKLLNELHEENTELKSGITALNGANTILKQLNTRLKQDNKHFNDKITELHFENLQLTDKNTELKQRNNNQYQQLNTLWNLIENKDYETLENMIKQMKHNEEQLQKEWKCYDECK